MSIKNKFKAYNFREDYAFIGATIATFVQLAVTICAYMYDGMDESKLGLIIFLEVSLFLGLIGNARFKDNYHALPFSSTLVWILSVGIVWYDMEYVFGVPGYACILVALIWFVLPYRFVWERRY